MKKRILGILICMLIMTGSTIGFAGDGNGESQLLLESVTVQDSLENVTVDETIFLEFSNNVVNMKVKDANMTCFGLTTANGDPVDFEVYMGDDQVDKDIKRIVEIRPASRWSEGTTYTLAISGELTAKNGISLLEDTIVEFKTEGENPEESKDSTSSVISIVVVIGIVILGGAVFGFRKGKEK